MSKLVDKLPPFIVPAVQTLVATAIAAFIAWLSTQGLIKDVNHNIKELEQKVTILSEVK